ncbi:MAG: PAS domain S-box protein [Burkholderiaceae bacterium]
MPTPSQQSDLDFDLLYRQAVDGPARVRRATLWLMGLLVMLLTAVVSLVLYLQRFESEEEQRRQAADAQWVEQAARFHFRRLEEDLQGLAQRARVAGAPETLTPGDEVAAGQLLRIDGVVLDHGWLPRVVAPDSSPVGRRLASDGARSQASADALNVMLDVARGLRRPAYAGPLPDTATGGHLVWLAVPLFDQGRYAGSYLARLSLERAVATLVPEWFLADHTVTLVDPGRPAAPGGTEQGDPAFLELPGTDIALLVRSTVSQSPTVPRTFFVVAMVCLLGMLVSLYALRRDFAKRLRVERALQAQMALRSAMENAVTIGLRAWDTEGRILYVNRSFCEMVGFEPHELTGRKAPLPYWPQSQVDELDIIHRSVIAQGTEQEGVEVQFQHRLGHLVDVLIHEAPLKSADGTPIGWMSSVLDISERKRSERVAARQQERLEASGRLVAMGEVASTLAHELNQPLGALSGFASGLVNRLKAGRITPAETLGVAERMEQLAAKAGRIIQRVNAFARRREMSRQRMDLVPLVRRLVEPLQRRRGMALRLNLPDTPVWIDGDALLLEHALLNLLGNAEHWAREPGVRQPWVAVDLQCRDGMAELMVSDSGPGVPVEQRDHIFSAFYTAKDDGMGMGLAICRSVIEAHHGQIEVGTAPDGGGACFSLKIPVSIPETP